MAIAQAAPGWYLVGLGLIAAVAIIYPTSSDLYLGLGDRPTALLYGFVYGAIGVAQAVAFAMLRYHHLRFPDVWAYPGSILNAIATAFIDEVTFRGLLLAFLVLGGIDPTVAIVIQALIYTLATRVGAPGRDRYDARPRPPHRPRQRLGDAQDGRDRGGLHRPRRSPASRSS